MAPVDDRRFIELPLDDGEALVWARGPVESSTTAVLFLHDRAMNARAWDLVMRRLPPGVAAVAPDLRGRGSAWRHPSSEGVDHHAADLERMIDQLDIDHVLAVGHRFGAAVAQRFRRRAPDRVVMVVGVLGEGPDPFHDVVGRAFRDRLDHRRYWEQHPALAVASDIDSIEGFLGHGIAGPIDHHQWRVDLHSVIADDASLSAAASGSDTPATEIQRFTRSIIAGPGAASVANGTLGSVTHLPRHAPATVLLTSSGADAVAAQVHPLLAPTKGR